MWYVLFCLYQGSKFLSASVGVSPELYKHRQSLDTEYAAQTGN